MAIQEDLIEAAKTAQSEQAEVLLQTFQDFLASDPNDKTALLGCHIIMWRAQHIDSAVDALHRLLANLDFHPGVLNLVTNHFPSHEEYLSLVDAYISRYPADPWGYMMAVAIHHLIMELTKDQQTQQRDLIKKAFRQCYENADKGFHFQPVVTASVFDAAKGQPYTSLGDRALVEAVRTRVSARQPLERMQVWEPSEKTTDGGQSTSQSRELPRVVTKEAEPIDLQGANVNGSIGGTTLPTQYYFRYGQSPEQLDRQTTTRHLPPGRFGHVRDGGENLFHRLSYYSLSVCFTDPRPISSVGDNEEAPPPCTTSAKLQWPFGSDRNHLNGIGVVSLLSGWESAAHLRGKTPPPFDSEAFPKPAFPGEAIDIRDGVFTLTYRAANFDAKDFHLVAWMHAGTGEALIPEVTENMAAWACTNGLGERKIVADGQWRQLVFNFTCDSRSWSFCGTNTEEMGSHMARYTYFPIGKALRENRSGNICLCFIHGNELDTPEGDIEIGALELSYRSRSLLAPGQGAELISWPEPTSSDPGLLTEGWIGDMDHCWHNNRTPGEAQDFVWRFREQASISSIRLHQHPLWPSKGIEVAVSDDGDDFKAVWAGELKDAPADPADWPSRQEQPGPFSFAEVAVMEPPARGRYIRLRVQSGYREECTGLDAFEVFGDQPAPLPSPEACGVSEEIGGIGPGPLFVQLVAENAAGRSEGEVVEVPRPLNNCPHVTNPGVIKRWETGAAVRLRTNAMGSPATAEVRLESADGGTITSTPVSIGKWPVARDTVIRITGLEADTAYKGECIATNEHGHGAPCPVVIGAANEKGSSPPLPEEWTTA